MEIEQIMSYFSSCGLPLNTEKALQFRQYQALIRQENRKLNLTRILQPQAILEEHFYDALAWLPAGRLQPAARLLDLGTGAGFPGIPLKIVLPSLKMYLLEATRKKIIFLKKVIKELNLREVTLFQQRAEVLARGELRESFAWVTARALAPLAAALELALPLVRVGGFFWAWKGPAVFQELAQAEHILARCGGKLIDQFNYRLPQGNKERTILIFKKVAPAEDYFPRRDGIPQKRPLFNKN
ncbi:MAG: 16S rRNA (guanine(527)-N(7))-methyltransferase RsmG [Firmicutes bacterium]|jgi:16S rRNA (guanine527-N7)-methyltransferase|nr:16S rRNA (guanine(527)-N(7))-methyltransferase RsmG [Bacillota bacterium]